MMELSQNIPISQFHRGRSRIRNLLARRPNNSKSVGADNITPQTPQTSIASQSRPTSRSSVTRGYSQASLNSPVFVDNAMPQTPVESQVTPPSGFYQGRGRERSVSVTRSASKTRVAMDSNSNLVQTPNSVFGDSQPKFNSQVVNSPNSSQNFNSVQNQATIAQNLKNNLSKSRTPQKVTRSHSCLNEADIARRKAARQAQQLISGTGVQVVNGNQVSADNTNDIYNTSKSLVDQKRVLFQQAQELKNKTYTQGRKSLPPCPPCPPPWKS